ncbi:hypothetical protein C9374_009934 [Naegleria lovaniensis]|uniref:G domain-containing protein n=1 Tax=Naegleria lovaniensis TaxID=51637 RepID=A0AA88GEY8_NAELO|nr:uncharacterized protein C9374_009934 [Naegleria lovaniensis]KAG2375311.1 hypothetical protein C9374_009934 [Naegleria lovaniensis]
MKTLPISGQLENAEAVRRLPPSLMLSILCGESRMLSHNITLFPYLFNQELVVETKQAYPTSPINILLAGQVGSGKSTLINSMFTCVNKDMVYVAGVMRKTSHATVTTSRFHLYGYNSYRQDIEPLNIAFTDTVGVSSINYNEDESIEFLLKGGIPDIMKEQEKAELEREIMLADQNITFWQQVFEKMSEEALKPNNNRGDFKESNKLEVLNFNIAAEMKRIEGLKKQLEQIELYLKKEREKQLPTLNTLQKRVHAIIFLVTHSPMQPDSDTPLRKNLVRFIERAVSLGYVPVVGVTNLLYSDVNKVRNEVANGLGVSSNNVFEVKANLEEKEKQFEVDKRIFEILLTAVQRGKQYIQKERIRLAKDEL